jgi:uncharacterized cupin superfamily protein
MEPHPGVFLSHVKTEEWEPDPEVPGSEMHELVHADGVWAGLTRFTTVNGPSLWTPSQRETIHVLEGEVTIEIAGGPVLELKPGDLASLSGCLASRGSSGPSSARDGFPPPGGYGATGMEAIAREAGMAPRTVYTAFRDQAGDPVVQLPALWLEQADARELVG